MPIPLGRQAWAWKEAPSSLAAFDGAYVRVAKLEADLQAGR